MSHPDDELLAAVALDEEVHPTIRDHVDQCAECTREVAAFRRALTLARQQESSVALTAPPAHVWQAVVAEVDRPARALSSVASSDASAPQPDPGRPAPQPDPARAARPTSRRRTSRTAPWVAGAAAAGILVGAGGVLLVDRVRGAETTAVATVSLQTLDTAHRTLGQAEVVRSDGAVDLRVDTDSLTAGTGYLEVWLINADGKRMVSVGVLRNGLDRATFPISSDLIDQGYVVVDISREAYDDKPQHSGDSLVRGTLPL